MSYLFAHPFITIVAVIGVAAVAVRELGKWIERNVDRPLDPDQDERAMSAQAISKYLASGKDFRGKDES